MKTKLLGLILLAGTSLFARSHFSFGVAIGGYGPVYAPAPVYTYYAPPPVRVEYVRPRYPGVGYSWVGGYWHPAGHAWGWHRGYWARRSYRRTVWVAPRYSRHYYYSGYWRR